MAELTPHEAEQWEKVKNFWKKYGKRFSTVFFLLILGISGFRYWDHKQQQIIYAASKHYSDLWRAVEQGDAALAKSKADLLVDLYYRTPYAELAALFLAQTALENNDYATARKHLIWITEQNHTPILKASATARLARLMAFDGQVEGALQLLERPPVESFISVFEEIRGDIFFEQKEFAKARTAYSKAFSSSGLSEEERPLLALKLNQLGRE
jgi:predicted negative regulator of RcsB-dependent stress response